MTDIVGVAELSKENSPKWGGFCCMCKCEKICSLGNPTTALDKQPGGNLNVETVPQVEGKAIGLYVWLKSRRSSK